MSPFTAYLLDCITVGILLGAWCALAVAFVETLGFKLND